MEGELFLCSHSSFLPKSWKLKTCVLSLNAEMDVIDGGGSGRSSRVGGDGIGGDGGGDEPPSSRRDTLPTLQIFRSSKKETKKVLEQVITLDASTVIQKGGTSSTSSSSSSSVSTIGASNHQRFAFDVVTSLKRISLAAKNSADFLLWKHRLNGAIVWSRAQLAFDEEEDMRKRRRSDGFLVRPLATVASERNSFDPDVSYLLHFEDEKILLTDRNADAVMAEWPYQLIRRFTNVWKEPVDLQSDNEGKSFYFEAGSRCGTGEGEFWFQHQPQTINNNINASNLSINSAANNNNDNLKNSINNNNNNDGDIYAAFAKKLDEFRKKKQKEKVLGAAFSASSPAIHLLHQTQGQEEKVLMRGGIGGRKSSSLRNSTPVSPVSPSSPITIVTPKTPTNFATALTSASLSDEAPRGPLTPTRQRQSTKKNLLSPTKSCIRTSSRDATSPFANRKLSPPSTTNEGSIPSTSSSTISLNVEEASLYKRRTGSQLNLSSSYKTDRKRISPITFAAESSASSPTCSTQTASASAAPSALGASAASSASATPLSGACAASAAPLTGASSISHTFSLESTNGSTPSSSTSPSTPTTSFSTHEITATLRFSASPSSPSASSKTSTSQLTLALESAKSQPSSASSTTTSISAPPQSHPLQSSASSMTPNSESPRLDPPQSSASSSIVSTSVSSISQPLRQSSATSTPTPTSESSKSQQLPQPSASIFGSSPRPQFVFRPNRTTIIETTTTTTILKRSVAAEAGDKIVSHEPSGASSDRKDEVVSDGLVETLNDQNFSTPNSTPYYSAASDDAIESVDTKRKNEDDNRDEGVKSQSSRRKNIVGNFGGGNSDSSFYSSQLRRQKPLLNNYAKLYSFDDRKTTARITTAAADDDENDADVDDDDYEPIDEEIAMIWERDMRRKWKDGEEGEEEGEERAELVRRLSSIPSSVEDDEEEERESTTTTPTSIIKSANNDKKPLLPFKIVTPSPRSIKKTSSSTVFASASQTSPLPPVQVASTKIVLMKATLEKKARTTTSCIRKASSTSCLRMAQVDLGMVTKDIGAV